jgi:hypothetical protein
MSELLNLIRDLFTSIFSGNVKTSRLRRELKKVYRDLRQRNPDFFKPHTNEVLPAFAEAVHKWSQYVRALNELFEKTLFSPNSRMAELFRDHLIESKLEENSRLLKAEFTYAAMKARFAGTASFKETLAEISRQFDGYLALFRNAEFSSCDEELTHLERFALLSRFPYEKLLSFFDPGTATLDRRYKPRFVPVLAQNLTQELMDLYFSMAEVDLDQGIAQNVVVLFRRLKKVSDSEEEEKIRKIVSLLALVQSKYLSRPTLLCLVRLAAVDPQLTLPVDHEQRPSLELYKSRFLSRFELDREKLVRENTQTEVAGDLTTLFKGQPLLEMRGYSELLSRELQEEGYPHFTHLQAMRILKTFILTFFESSIKEHIKQLVIDAFFEQKTFREIFIAHFHETQSAAEKIAALENTLSEKGEVSALKVKEYLAKHRDGKTVSASLSQLVETINDNVDRLIESATNDFAQFHAAFEQLLIDAKQHTPSIISNIKVIGGERNPEFMNICHGDQETIAGFLGIMKHFTVIRQPAARVQRAQ